MTSVAAFTIPAAEFPLGSVFESLPDVTIELERVIPVESRTVPYLWVHGPTKGDIESAFAGHPAIEEITLVESIGDEHLLRVEWRPTTNGILQAILDADVTLLSATGTATQWRFEIRAEDHRQIAAFEEACQADGLPIELVLLQPVDPEWELNPVGLTEKQREALAVAFRRGYFSSPREVTLEDIAEELGISRQSLSSRVRRGLYHVLEATLEETNVDR